MKTIFRLPALFLSLCIFFSACVPSAKTEELLPRTTENFSQIVYTRPDLEALLDKTDEAISKANSALLPFGLLRSMSELSDLTEHFYTQQTIAMIRNANDVRDSFYREEITFLDQASNQIQTRSNTLYEEIFASRFAALFEWMLGKENLEEQRLSSEITSPEILSLQEEESRLCAQYSYQFAQASVFFHGKQQQYSALSPEDQATAAPLFLEKYNPIFGELFIKLVSLRDEMAKKLGFADYTQVADRQMLRTCYSRSEIKSFRDSLKKDLAPLYRRYQQDFFDRASAAKPGTPTYLFGEATPSPSGNWEDTLDSFETLFGEMSPETQDCFGYLRSHELINVVPSPNKANLSFTTTLYELNAPYIFANFDESAHDVLTFTHEFGHAFASYRQQELGSNSEGRSMDICEMHSQIMQLLALPQLELFYGKDAALARKYTIYTLLSGILSAAADDEFQETIYQNPSMTLPEINALYRKLLLDYGLMLDSPYLDLELESLGWFSVNQYFDVPFYSIDYALSGCVALEFLQLMNEDYDKALQTYFLLVEQPPNADFLTVLKNTKLQNPLTSNAFVKAVPSLL